MLLRFYVYLLTSLSSGGSGSSGGNGWCAVENCCSRFSYCGLGNDWCGSGCQHGYGSCSSLTSTFSLVGPTSFDGTNYLYYPSLSPALGITFSIAFWITPQAIPSASAVVFMGRSSSNINGEFVVSILSPGKIDYWEYNINYGIQMTTSSILKIGIIIQFLPMQNSVTICPFCRSPDTCSYCSRRNGRKYLYKWRSLGYQLCI